jgi:predicted RNase H-like nuclease (RuvC/YqgF family)
MSDDYDTDPKEAKAPSPKPIPENKTVEKLAMENRRLRTYVTVFQSRVMWLESLETLCRQLIAESPLGMVDVDAYERRLKSWGDRLTRAIAEADRTRKELEAKTP